MMIIKRDGSLEEFQKEKITRVVVATGLDESQANMLTENVVSWVNNQGESKITSLMVRDRVLEELGRINKYAANLFSWYEKTKEQ